ncbi:trans-resveratrol di-O-methyltransferase-like [Silene latifolia]|uniref:trans-resveratrol di-O-methyltransferase-like n=1 Tax=Silene latifolia TaxID=37657 RepID=UPI003D76F788
MENPKELLNAQAHIWNHIFAYHRSSALKCAVELGIPDTIQKHGNPMTLQDLANSLAIGPNKIRSLYRLLRLLVHSNFFSMTKLVDGEEAYANNINSQLLLKDHPCTLAPFTLGMLDPSMTEAPQYLSKWFQNQDESVFHVVHGRSFWEHAGLTPELNQKFNRAMGSDTSFVSSVLVTSKDFKKMVEGLGSLVDVAGGNGTMAKTIARAYPWLKCIVFDLPHVVDGLQGNESNLEYVAGDMFKKIPSADVVMLKWILHDWSDEHCVRILERCKEAIPSNGKIIIIDMVVDPQAQNNNHFHAQLLSDMEMMALNVGGIERTEDQWKKLFLQAGFNHYNIFPILGIRSVIEVRCL